MLAFNNDPQLKINLLAEVHKHYLADQIIKGSYGKENGAWKGCAVGCSIRSYNLLRGESNNTSDHAVFEKFGIPRLLARLNDTIFEGLPATHNREWPERFLAAIQPGADLHNVWPKFAHWLMIDPEHGVIRFANGRQDVIDSINGVAMLYENGEWPAAARWSAAADAAARWSADAAAAADAAARWSADAAAAAARWSADAAAAARWSADAAAAADAADAAARWSAAADAAADAADAAARWSAAADAAARWSADAAAAAARWSADAAAAAARWSADAAAAADAAARWSAAADAAARWSAAADAAARWSAAADAAARWSAAAADAARYNEYIAQGDKLVELLKAA